MSCTGSLARTRPAGLFLFLFVLFAAWGSVLCLPLSAAPKSKSSTGAKPANDFGFQQVATINQHVRAGWEDYEIRPSVHATDGEWCRRVYLDILGRIPSVAELQAYLKEKSPDRRRELVNMLLQDEQYVEEYARNWTSIWSNVLIGRNGGNERNSLTSRAGMQKYLRDSFARNTPYNDLVFELISASGTNTPGSSEFNGAVNFLAMKLAEMGSQATAQTSRIFLGLQVQCTQCHNHPFNEWRQAKFWEMNAFFRQTVALRRFQPGTRDVRMVELTDQDFGGESNNPLEAELYYELRNGLLKVAYPVFIDGAEIERSGFVTDVNRRRELARLIVDSTYMQEAIVNRMWAHFLGYGFTKPIDDMGPHNPATHPELLKYLGQQLRDHSMDLKQLISWLALSEPYSLSSKLNRTNVQDDPQLGETPKFSRFYLRQMRAEELYESLLVATQAHKTSGSYEDQERLKSQWLQQFTIAFGTDEGDETTTFNGTIPQVLMMFNGELMKKATSVEKGGFLHTVARSELKPAKQIEYLFLAGLARRPSRQEILVANKLLMAREGSTAAALQDIWWAVLNSNEFILNH